MKIIGSADLHLKDFQRFNLTMNSRLDQYLELAKLMASSAVKHEAKAIIFAGDLLDSVTPPPVVYHYLHKFIEILVKSTSANIYIIHGNHDINSKTEIRNLDIYYPSVVGMYPSERVKYVHDEYVILDGCKFFFRGWEPEFKSVPPCDVFVGHGFVNNASTAHGFSVKGSDVRVGKSCKLAILGDIHKGQVLDNVFIPGVPIQNSFSDDPNTSYFILDTNELDPTKILRESTVGRFLEFRYADDERLSEFDDSETPEDYLTKHKIVIKKRDLTTQSFSSEDIKSLSSINFEDLLEALISDFKYLDELRSCLGKTYADESIIAKEFKVKLLSLDVTNFKSIESLNLNFADLKKLTVLTGENGTGKSTLLQAFVWCISGNSEGDIDDVIQSNKDYCEVSVEVEYDSKVIKIKRSRGSRFKFQFWINSEEVIANTKSQLQDKLKSQLPIITRLSMLYFNQSRDGLLSSLDDSSRVSLISELSGQTVITNLTLDIESKVEELKEDLRSSTTTWTSASSRLKGMKDSLVDIPDPTPTINSETSKVRELESDLKALEKIFEDDLKEFDKSHSKDLEVHDSKIKDLNSQNLEYHNKLLNLSTQKNSLTPIINKQPTWECKSCHTILKSEDYSLEQVKNAESKLEGINTEIQELNDKIKEIKSELNGSTMIKRSITDKYEKDRLDFSHPYKCKINNLESLISNYNTSIGALKNELKHFETFQRNSERVKELETEVENLKEETENIQDKYQEFKSIRGRVFGSDGLFAAAVLSKIAEGLNSDPTLRITTTKVLKNGKIKPTLDIDMFVDVEWQNYRRLSGGQKLYADLYLLIKIIEMTGGIGFLFLDETLKYADSKVSLKMFEMIVESRVSKSFLIYHGDVSTEFDDVSVLRVTREKGVSSYELL